MSVIDANAAVRAYSFVDLGLMDIKNIDLPEKVKHKTKARRIRANKRILGRSIDERSPTRKDFGHWECDLVLRHKTKDDDVLLTLCERKTRTSLLHDQD